MFRLHKSAIIRPRVLGNVKTKLCSCNHAYDYKNVCPRSWAGIAQSVQRLATGCTVRGSNPGGDEIFRTRLHRPGGPPSLLYNGYRVSCQGGKAAVGWH
jgi:hypothetical protein